MRKTGWLLVAGFVGMVAASGLCSQAPFQDEAVEVKSGVSLEDPELAVQAEPTSKSSNSSNSFFGGLLQTGKNVFSKAKDTVGGWFGSAKNIFDLIKDTAPKLLNLPGWYRQGHLSDKARRELLKLAASHPGRAWPADKDIAEARNAHRTTTFDELKEGLEGNYDYLEADLRMEGPLRDHLSVPGPERRPVVAHDSYQTNGILFEDWVDVVKASGKGIKVDFKDSQAIGPVIDILKNAKIPEYRIIMNIGIPAPPPISLDELKDARLKQIRSAFPKCILNLSPGGEADANGHYTARAVEQMIRYAKAAGQPVMFPLKAEMVTPEIVQKLRPFGKVAIWNDPTTFNPVDKEAEIEKFRSWGVDGMIDIRTVSS